MRGNPAAGVSLERWDRRESMGETERTADAAPKAIRGNRGHRGLLGGTAGWGPLALRARRVPWWKEKR